jgi:hypothetical protein
MFGSLLLFVGVFSGLSVIGQAQPYRGGSAYLYYGNDANYQCEGVIKNYNDPTAQGIIQNNLRTMYSLGQRRLTAMGWNMRDPGDCGGAAGKLGTTMNSNLNNFEYQFIYNMRDYFLFARDQVGFQEFLVIMGPQWNNDPKNQCLPACQGYDDSYYPENWQVITATRSILDQAGLFYRLVLIDEPFINESCFSCLSNYVGRLWSDYYGAYGSDVFNSGVTITADGRYNQTYAFLDIVDYFGWGRPNLFFFNDGWTDHRAYDYFRNFNDALNSRGAWYQGVIISSATYDDFNNAQGLANARQDTGRTIFYVSQWPTNPPTYNSVDAFNNYIFWGF